MITDPQARANIAGAIANALDDLVRERLKGLVEEPDITSRVGQRLEERFDGKVLGGYQVQVITETITSHGRGSLEKPMGTDLYFAISVEDERGAQKSKAVLIQAKRADRVDWNELSKQCRRMNLITKKGSVVWLYSKRGIEVIRSEDVLKNDTAAIDASAFFDRVLECEIGDQRKVPGGEFGDRSKLKSMLTTLGARNAVWLGLEEQA